MTLATGVGSHPGDTAPDFDEAVRVVLGEAPDLPYLPELPGRGAVASMTGRALAIVDGIDADMQPAGWRLTDASGVDHRRARSLLAQDLDVVEEHTQGFTGDFKVQVAGPWTLAAAVERPRGDKVLADHGARRELAQALAEGLRGHIADVRRRVAAARLVVQVDEPALGAVAEARIPTASGYGRHRAVDRPELATALEWVLAAITEAGAEPWVHSCAADVPWDLVVTAGARGLLLDPLAVPPAAQDAVAGGLDAGLTVGLGVVPSLDASVTDKAVTERALRWLDLLGFDPGDVGDRLVITPSCGLAGATPAWARRALSLSTAAARALS